MIKNILKYQSVTYIKAALGLLWPILASLGFYYMQSSDQNLTELAAALFGLMADTPYGIFLFLLVSALRPLLFIPTTLLLVMSGTFFGFGEGLILALIGSNLGAMMAYGVGYFFAGENTKLNSRFPIIKDHTFASVLLARLSFVPYDIISFGSGLLRLPFSPYFAATIIGNLFSTIAFATLGASFDISSLLQDGLSFDLVSGPMLLTAIVFTVMGVALSIYLKSKYQPAVATYRSQ